MIEPVDPQLVVRQLEKVGKQEHEAPTGHRAPVRFQMLEDARQEVRLGGERTVESQLRQRPLRARWTPQRFLFGEIEVAEKAAYRKGAVGDHVCGIAKRGRLREPRQRC